MPVLDPGTEVRWSRGDVARCTRAPRGMRRSPITLGQEYLVIEVRTICGVQYLRILSDENEGRVLLHTLFERVPWSLSSFSDEEVAREYYTRVMRGLGDQSVGASICIHQFSKES